MIVNRRTFKVKKGRMQEAATLLRTGGDYMDNIPPYRIYTSSIGTFNLLVLEQEFENLAAYEKFWNAHNTAPETPALMGLWVRNK